MVNSIGVCGGRGIETHRQLCTRRIEAAVLTSGPLALPRTYEPSLTLIVTSWYAVILVFSVSDKSFACDGLLLGVEWSQIQRRGGTVLYIRSGVGNNPVML